MAILRERVRWERHSTRAPRGGQLTPEQKAHVGRAVRFLRDVLGFTNATLAKKLGVGILCVSRAAGRRPDVSAATAVAVARHTGVSVDDVLEGRWPPEWKCPRCGRYG